ncbi:MAG TPA: hypothetical protein VLA84_09950, partial [Microcoleus sp.]|nr:hypothetical protein [Microcoleus sp.]
QYENSPELFSPAKGVISSRSEWESYFLSSIKDFHTSGKVSASLGIPLRKLPHKEKYIMPNGETVIVTKERYKDAREQVSKFVSRI